LLRFLGLPLTRAGLPSKTLTFGAAWPGPAMTSPAPRVQQQIAVNEPAAPTANPDYFELYKEIFSKMVKITSDAGAKFVFVNIPALGTVCDGVEHPQKRQVLDFVRRSGVDFLDLEQ